MTKLIALPLVWYETAQIDLKWLGTLLELDTSVSKPWVSAVSAQLSNRVVKWKSTVEIHLYPRSWTYLDAAIDWLRRARARVSKWTAKIKASVHLTVEATATRSYCYYKYVHSSLLWGSSELSRLHCEGFCECVCGVLRIVWSTLRPESLQCLIFTSLRSS